MMFLYNYYLKGKVALKDLSSAMDIIMVCDPVWPGNFGFDCYIVRTIISVEVLIIVEFLLDKEKKSLSVV